MMRVVPIIAGLVVLVGSAVLHGQWTGRWEAADPGQATAGRLDQVPLTLGEWEGQTVPVNESDLPPMLTSHMFRKYTNRTTGETVSVSGPTAVHTPDMCFVGGGYELVAPPAKVTAPVGDAEFFSTRFRKVRLEGTEMLRVFWSWSTGSTWQAPANPRLAFARYPVLYKLYLIHPMKRTDEPLPEDACMQFMQVFLPEFQRVLTATD
jgi:Protein of unknown function (DUF3485)